MVDQLNDMKINILDYVESRMSLVAPNLSVILGSSIAAKMMGLFIHIVQYRNVY